MDLQPRARSREAGQAGAAMFSWLSPSKEAAEEAARREAEAATAAALAALPPGTVIHPSVWCDACARVPGPGLIGPRFKCLVCPNVDLCKDCFVTGKGPAEHSDKHHVLCLPTPAPEVLQTFQFPGLKCAYCAREGFFGSAYTCAQCPPAASGGCTSTWCESCAWCQTTAAAVAPPFCVAVAHLSCTLQHSRTAPAGELQALHDKTHPRIKRIPVTPVPSAASASAKSG